MPLVPGIRALLSLHKAPLHVRQFSLYATSPLSRLTSRMLCTTKQNVSDAKPKVQKENESLVARLTLMGVDVNMVLQRRPGVLRSTTTNEQGLLGFLQSKGASRTLVAGIISRSPRAIYPSTEVLEQRWELWHSILESDSEILSILVDRAPRSFFRPSDNYLEKNILFLSSRGLNTKLLAKRTPHIFCNTVELNRQMVSCKGPTVSKMPLVPGIRALLSLHKAPLHVRQFSLYATSPRSRLTSRMLCTTKQNVSDAKPEQNASDAKPEVQKENDSLVVRLTLMGVDVNMVRQRRPGVLRSTTTNEQGLLGFLQSKGASRTMVAGIISRNPCAIYRSTKVLKQRWGLWHSILESDSEILRMLDRSPRTFFRLSNNCLEKNILFLSSRGLNTKLLAKRTPRIFCSSVEFNRQMVKFLEDVCEELDGEDPESFANAVITKHSYILTRSVGKVKTNLVFLRVSLKLSDLELLDFLRGSGVVNLSNRVLINNFEVLEQRLLPEGCRREDIRTMLMNYPEMLMWGHPDKLNAKLDCLLEGGITVEQLMKDPRVLGPDL